METKAPIRLAGSVLRDRAHVCAFFNRAEEAHRALLSLVQEGIRLGQKSLHAVPPRDPDKPRHRLIIIGGVLHENPFFVLPEEFLQEIRDRRMTQAAVRASAV